MKANPQEPLDIVDKNNQVIFQTANLVRLFE